ncbi:MAG: hypothetical protein COT84_02030 [Chlamydiae bacterium CG10_big_fil_rev_8_21_14_0_10_35_9]|nr:MAG: hypothetical protein COT84_02030 [Chlamydiae bacterium CG10_big_fil_rev_8_21_14_0_10_35_9]
MSSKKTSEKVVKKTAQQKSAQQKINNNILSSSSADIVKMNLDEKIKYYESVIIYLDSLKSNIILKTEIGAGEATRDAVYDVQLCDLKLVVVSNIVNKLRQEKTQESSKVN